MNDLFAEQWLAAYEKLSPSDRIFADLQFESTLASLGDQEGIRRRDEILSWLRMARIYETGRIPHGTTDKELYDYQFAVARVTGEFPDYYEAKKRILP